MYNRYIPQPDGSYQKKTVPAKGTPSRPTAAPTPPRQEAPVTPCAPDTSPPRQPTHKVRRPTPRRQQPYHPKQPVQGNVSDFLKQLLPKDFDTGDLLVLLLLLLMSGDSEEDQNTALLTMALYFFL